MKFGNEMEGICGDDCILAGEFDEVRRKFVFQHAMDGEPLSPEADLRLEGCVILDQPNPAGFVYSQIRTWLRSHHNPPRPDDFDEDAERARLRPI